MPRKFGASEDQGHAVDQKRGNSAGRPQNRHAGHACVRSLSFSGANAHLLCRIPCFQHLARTMHQNTAATEVNLTVRQERRADRCLRIEQAARRRVASNSPRPSGRTPAAAHANKWLNRMQSYAFRHSSAWIDSRPCDRGRVLMHSSG